MIWTLVPEYISDNYYVMVISLCIYDINIRMSKELCQMYGKILIKMFTVLNITHNTEFHIQWASDVLCGIVNLLIHF